MSLWSPNATWPSAPSTASPADSGRSGRTLILAGLLAAACALAGGCSATQLNSVVVKLFEPKRSAQQHMVVAFASEDPDLRRAALAKVAKSKQHDRDWAIKGYVAVALFDTDAQARCVALRALARTGDRRATETALKVLNHRAYPPAEVRPPGALCRGDAAKALADLSAAGHVPEELGEPVRAALVERLRSDSDRHARIAAARGLGFWPDEEAVRVLIEGLNDGDFAVVHECEESLVRLTGHTHNCNALAWEDWFAANEPGLFARAGQVPESRRPPYRNRFEKIGYDFKRFVRWLVPEGREK